MMLLLMSSVPRQVVRVQSKDFQVEGRVAVEYEMSDHSCGSNYLQTIEVGAEGEVVSYKRQEGHSLVCTAMVEDGTGPADAANAVGTLNSSASA